MCCPFLTVAVACSRIEGKFDAGLTYIPKDLFANKKAIKLIHFGVHPLLPAVPDVVDLPIVRKVEFAMMTYVKSVTMANLPNLELIQLVHLRPLTRLPDMGQFPKLRVLIHPYMSLLCCNGFLPSRPCDFKTGFCSVMSAYFKTSQCFSPSTDGPMATEGTVKALTTYALNCQPTFSTPELMALAPTAANMAQCGGVKYKQCAWYGQVGMCYTVRLQPVQCYGMGSNKSGYGVMRKAQISLGIGEPCDPAVEAWLGCQG